jgi:hypothetical protein
LEVADRLITQGGFDLSKIKLQKLTVEQILQIDDLLNGIGEYGKLALVVEHGKLKYINAMTSRKAQNLEEAAKDKT